MGYFLGNVKKSGVLELINLTCSLMFPRYHITIFPKKCHKTFAQLPIPHPYTHGLHEEWHNDTSAAHSHTSLS